MKKKGCLILLLGLLLSGCSQVDVINTNSSSEVESKSQENSFSDTSSEAKNTSEITSDYISEKTSNTSESIESSSEEEVTYQKEANINVRTEDVVETPAGSFVIDAKKITGFQYKTGDFKELKKQNVGVYRCYKKSNSDPLTLLETPSIYSYEQDSMIYNLTAYQGIYEYEITYNSECGMYLSYSSDKSFSNVVYLGKTSGTQTVNIKTNQHCLFRLQTRKGESKVESVKILYNKKGNDYNTDYKNYDEYRLDVPYTDFDNISDGEKRVMPTKVTYNNGHVNIINKKEYVYHTYDYLSNHPSEANDICLTDPVDIANYYLLFHDFPLNYQDQNDGSVPKNLSRAQSTYSRRNGYATSVPFKDGSGFVYFELDIDNTGRYYPGKNGRGVGRIVIWENSFNFSEYNNHPVIVYTDDHYNTFREYMNDGSFGPRFKAEGHWATYTYTKPTTLTY